MLAEPERTRYDLNFRLFGFPIRVHPWFWLGAALLGASALDRGIIFMLIWIAVVFVSILVHELGHAVAFRAFGTGSHIVLYVFGGLAVPWNDVRFRWQRILIALAGPVAGFLLCALVYFSNLFAPWAGISRPVASLYLYLVFINLVWGVFNLFPVFPLDGGRVAQEVCGAIWRRNGLRIALEISIGVAGLIALYSLACEFERRQDGGWFDAVPWWARGTFWTAILFAMLAVQNYQLLQQVQWQRSHWDSDDRPPWR